MSIYIELPEDVQEAVRILLLYFKQDRIARTPRPLYPKAVKRAARLLDVQNDWEVPRGEPNRWKLKKEEYWKERLALAGLDPDDPMRIIDQERWNLAWRQLVETNSFKAVQQQQAIAFGEKAETATGVWSAFSYRAQKKKDTPREESTPNPAVDVARAHLIRKIRGH